MSDQPMTFTDPLERAVLGPHRTIDHLASASDPTQLPLDPREAYEVTDAFMSVMSRHLAAIEDVLLPVARERLDDGPQYVDDYLRRARGLEQAVHAMKARLYGDVQIHHVRPEDLWEEIDGRLTEHETCETDLLAALQSMLTEEESVSLAEQILAAGDHAPTRPHPHTPHTGRIGRAAHRFWRVADGFWDTAEGRIIPHRRKPPHPKRGSLLTRYFTGVPRFEDPDRADRADRTER